MRFRLIHEVFLTLALILCATAAHAWTWNVVQGTKDENKNRRVAIYQAQEDPTVLRLRAVGTDWLNMKAKALDWLQANEACPYWCHPDDEGWQWTCYDTAQSGETCVGATGTGWTFASTNFSQAKEYTEMFSSRNKCVFELDELTICPTFTGPGCNLKNCAPPDCAVISGCLYRGVESYGCSGNKPQPGPLQCDECETKEICSECLDNCPVWRACGWCRPDTLSPWACYRDGDYPAGPDAECVETCP